MRNVTVVMALFLSTAVRGAETADQPALVLQTGGHTGQIHKVLFTPDGLQVVTVGDDRTARVWDRATGESLAVFRMPVVGPDQGALRAGAVYFSPDGKVKTLAVAGEPYKVGAAAAANVFLIDLISGAVMATLPGGESAVYSLGFSHDGQRLAGGDANGKVYVWDVAGRKLAHTLEGHTTVVWDVAFSPDDKRLATASADNTARLWDPDAGTQACPPLKHEWHVHCVAWQDDDVLFTGGRRNVFIHKWDRTGKHLKHFDKLRDKPIAISSLACLPDKEHPERARLFYTWTDDTDDAGEELCDSGGAVLNLRTGESHDRRTWTHHRGVVCGAVAPDGFLAATSGEVDKGVGLWDLGDGKMVRRLASRGQTPFEAGWSPNGHAVGWINFKKAAPQAAPTPTPPPTPRRGFPGKEEVKAPSPPTNNDGLQRSFDLAALHFGNKPGTKYLRAVHARGGLHLESPSRRTVEIRRKNDLVAAVKGGAVCSTLLPGERAAIGLPGTVALYNTRTGERSGTLNTPAGMCWDLVPSPEGRYLLAAFSDQTLRIYDPDKQDPLLSLFVAGSDWIVWTEQGYYAASPGGERLMGWQVNNGLDRLATFYPAEQFHKAFYRPDVIQRVLAEGSVAQALAAAEKDSGQNTQAVSAAQALPPEVNLLSPTAGPLDKAEVEVKAQAQSKDRPVLVMHLLLDGRPFPGAAAQTFPNAQAGAKQEAAWKVTLPDGEHHLVVLAETDASLGASAEVVLTWQAAQEPLPTLYVLAVGVNAYPGSLQLDWAVDDANAVAKAFTAGGAPKPYGKVEAKVLLDKDASREGILAGLDWLKDKMTADDTAVVFYAGHGHRDKKTGQFYLLPQDVDVRDLDKTGVTGTQLKKKFQAVPGRVLVLLDACHSGSIGQSPADPASLTDDVQRQLAAPDCGVVILCAAMAQEEAGEAAAVKHGFFTAALLKGLGGAAPPDRKDGLIHLTALNYYVEEEVAELSKDEQHVVVDRPSTVTSFPLVKSAGKSE